MLVSYWAGLWEFEVQCWGSPLAALRDQGPKCGRVQPSVSRSSASTSSFSSLQRRLEAACAERGPRDLPGRDDTRSLCCLGLRYYGTGAGLRRRGACGVFQSIRGSFSWSGGWAPCHGLALPIHDCDASVV